MPGRQWCGGQMLLETPRGPQLPAVPQSLLVSKLVSIGELIPCLHLPFQGQWDSSPAALPWARACSLLSVWLLSCTSLSTLKLVQDCSLGSITGTDIPGLHRCPPSPPQPQPQMGCPTLTADPFSPYAYFALGSWFLVYIQTPESPIKC